MFRRLFIIFLLAFLAMNAYSQKDSDSLLFNRYASLQPANDSEYFILKVAKNASAKVLNQLILLSERKFSENIFIVNKDVKNQLNLPEKFLLKSESANNNWKFLPGAERIFESKNSKMNHRFIVQFKNAKSVQNFMDDA
ncbi:MAG: hypothetical protein ABIR50_08600, partial [Ginsengibacter sp.]